MQLSRLMRGIGKYQWKPEPQELMGKPIGIIGLGAVGNIEKYLASCGEK